MHNDGKRNYSNNKRMILVLKIKLNKLKLDVTKKCTNNGMVDIFDVMFVINEVQNQMSLKLNWFYMHFTNNCIKRFLTVIYIVRLLFNLNSCKNYFNKILIYRPILN